jgi:hydroxyacylglutathione hydrolase
MSVLEALKRRLAAAEPQRVADGVWLIRGGLLRTMNVYLVEDGGSVVVFDTGEKGMADSIAAAAERLGGISRVVLGHADTDHRGSAPALSRLAPVVCHPDAVSDAQGTGGRDHWNLEQLPWLVRVVQRFSHDHVWDGGPVQISDTIGEGDEVAGFRVVDLPGHAPGQIGLLRERDGLALVSDCFYMTDLWGRSVPPQVPNDAYNLDTAQARESIRKLAALRPAACWPGHRGPLAGPDVSVQLLRAAGEPGLAGAPAHAMAGVSGSRESAASMSASENSTSSSRPDR